MSRSLLTRIAPILLAAGVAVAAPAPKPKPAAPPATPAVTSPVPKPAAIAPVAPPPAVDVTPVVPAPPPLPPLPPAAVVLAQPTAAGWLNAAGIPATVVSEAALPEALKDAVLAVVPVQEVRQTATAEALRAHLAKGGCVIASYWGPVGARSSAMEAMASVLNVNVTGWSGKGNAAIVPAPAGRAIFGPLTLLKTGRPFAVVATPVVPPPPPAPPAPPPVPAPAAPIPPQQPSAPKGSAGSAARPVAPGGNAPAPAVPGVVPPVAVAPALPPAPPPPAVAGRWVGDDGRPARKAPADAAVITAPGTLWVGEDIFLSENDTPEMRRWFAAAAVALAPSLRLAAKQTAIGAAQARLDAARARSMSVAAPGAGAALPVADAQRSLQAAAQSLAKASADMDYPTVLVDVAAANNMLLEAEAYLTPSHPVEVRAVRIEQAALSRNLADIRKLVQRLADARFNVILPEVVYAGRAAYPSAVYPQDKRLAGFDPLRVLVDEAHRRGMEVHPWVWTLAAGENGEQGPLLRKHPEWAARDKAGRIMTDGDRLFWLSPSVPAARLAVRNVIREIAARYDVDGIHLDYLRYHSPYYDYSGAARAAYKAQSGKDPMEIAPLSPAAAAWHAWREAQLNALVRDIRADVDSVKPGLALSASVHRAPEDARRDHLQDWPNWAANHWVAWVAPQTHTLDPGELSGWLSANLSAAAGKTLMVPGLAGSQGPNAAQWDAVRATPAQGMVLFTAGQLTDETLKSLRLGAFRAPAITPWKNPAQAARTLATFAADQLRATPVADAAVAVPVRSAIADLAAWGAGAGLEAFDTVPASVTALAGLGPAFDEVRALAAQTAEIAAVAAARPGGQPVAPTAPPVVTVANPIPTPRARVPVAMGMISVDGRLDESGWNGAASLSLDHAHDGGRAPVATTVRLLRDATTLYIGFTCSEPNMAFLRAVHTGQDAPVYQDDSVEVFLSPNDKGMPYYHFIVGAGGGVWDDKSADARWGARWTSAVSRDATGWYVEIGIPFNSLEGAPGGTWRANFARNRMADGPNFLTWSVPYGNYHAPDRFGALTF